jgi:molybdenum cofactor guanylyltransferase
VTDPGRVVVEPPVESIGAVVLAGGRSARFGRDKLLEPIDGGTLLEHAIEAVRSVASEVVVVTSPGVERAVPEGIILVEDPHPFEGPLVGLVTGLESLDESIERVIVVGGDMPSLEPGVLALLIAALHDDIDAAVLETDDGRAVIPSGLRRGPQLARARDLVASGERRLGAVLDGSRVAVVARGTWTAVDPDGRTLRDVDRPSDLDRPSDVARGGLLGDR